MLAIEGLKAEEFADLVIRTSIVRYVGRAFPCKFPHRVTVYSPLTDFEIQQRLSVAGEVDDCYPLEGYADYDATTTEASDAEEIVLEGRQHQRRAADVGHDDSEDEDEDDAEEASMSEPEEVAPSNGVEMKALQEELARLKMLIADVVTKQALQEEVNRQNSSSSNPAMHHQGPTSAPIPPPPPPFMAVGAPTGNGMSGPPPPPPPPLPPVGFGQENSHLPSVMDIIRQNKKKNGGSNKVQKENKPSMTDVLKGLGSVKLKSIARSPGGTPIRQKKESMPTDPASLIAAALKKKFAHRKSIMEEEEDDDWDEKEKKFLKGKESNGNEDNKNEPLFGQHLLKKTRKPLTSVNGPTVKEQA